jgi:cytochrome d ubiquinol oxidase subunit II
MFGAEVLSVLGAASIAFAFLCYVLLDGTDLGVGMLITRPSDNRDRQTLAYSMLPLWDGNETWLVLGAGALLAMFPEAYARFLSALYVPLWVMLLALVVRGFTLEFRDHYSPPGRRIADRLLCGASAAAAASQGICLGTLIQGLSPIHAGELWDWFAAFPLFCALLMLCVDLWLGSCWLVWRTQGATRTLGRRLAHRFALGSIALSAAALFWMLAGETPARWPSSAPLTTLAMLCLLLVGLASVLFFRLPSGADWAPLFVTLAWITSGFLLGSSLFVEALTEPGSAFRRLAISPFSQGFVLLGFAVLVPVTLAYSTYSFWVFRGKVGRLAPRG